jgi:hypothetical protein
VAVLGTDINDDALLERLFAAAPFTHGTGEGGAPVREREERWRARPCLGGQAGGGALGREVTGCT